jgi:TatD DNase family protein
MNDLRLIDTHAHLNLDHFASDRELAIARMAAASVQRSVEVGFDLGSSRAAIALAHDYPAIYAVVGVQPNHLADLPVDWLAQLRELAARPKVVAIGEIGFDFYWNKAPIEQQEMVFREQLALARELNLPVIIHTRDAHADTLRVLREAARGQPGVMHSFAGDWDFASSCLDVGFLLSFSGSVTFKRNTELHEVARRAPADMILTETDSPYLAPHPHRGKRNEPAYVTVVVQQLAALRGKRLEDLAAQLWSNAERIFRFEDRTTRLL